MKYKDLFLIPDSHMVTRRAVKMTEQFALLLYGLVDRLDDDELALLAGIGKKTIVNVLPKIHEVIGSKPIPGMERCNRKALVRWAIESKFILVEKRVPCFNLEFLIEPCDPETEAAELKCFLCRHKLGCKR